MVTKPYMNMSWLAPGHQVWNRHPEPSGTIWSHLEPSGAIWSHLEQSGAMWSYLEIWSHLVPSEVIWGCLGLLGTCWAILSHLEPSGALGPSPHVQEPYVQQTICLKISCVTNPIINKPCAQRTLSAQALCSTTPMFNKSLQFLCQVVPRVANQGSQDHLIQYMTTWWSMCASVSRRSPVSCLTNWGDTWHNTWWCRKTWMYRCPNVPLSVVACRGNIL